MSPSLLEIIRRSGRSCRDPGIKNKLALFERAIALGRIAQACQEVGKRPRYYYYWWNRFRDSGFQLEALERKAHERRVPPKKSSTQIKTWIRHYRKQFRYSPELIALHLEQKHHTHVSKSTVYRILKSEGLHTRRRKIRGSSSPTPPSPHRGVAPPALASMAGRRIGGRFLIEEEIGRGGSGIVYRAKDLRRAEREIALKVVGPLPEGSSDLELLLKKEFQTLASLHHRHLGQVFDFGQEGAEVFFSSELIEGRDLLAFAREANLNVVFQLILQTLRGLDYLHSRGVLHLDLKPQNILITDTETGEPSVKIIDFGNAQWLKKGGKEFEEFTGSPPYTAPEIILEQAPSPSSDLYSLGILFHQMFCKGLPFASQDPLEIMKLQIYEDPDPAQGLNPALPESFAEILRRMVARQPGRRYADVPALLKDINACLGENFTLRSERAPAHVLDESDWLFHSGFFSQLLTNFSSKKSHVCVLSGPEGAGKSHLARKLREALQIRGVHPWWCESPEELKSLLKKNPSFPALLIDGFELSAEEMIPLLSSLENLGVPVLLNTRMARSTAMNPHEWIELGPLSLSQIRDFLHHEIIEPPPPLASNILEASSGIPRKMEKVFQAVREEGFLQWSGEGWRWAAEDSTPLDFQALSARQEARWEERLATLREILKFSTLPLDARSLEGMLGLEAGGLEEKLKAWTEQGWLSVKRIKKLPHYSLKESGATLPEMEMKDWAWAETNLAKLYEEAAYDQGVRWTEYLLSRQAAGEVIPEKIALLGARHLVLAGQARRAQEVLPKHPPENSREGLYFEIQGRIQWGLGNLSAAEPIFESALHSFKAHSDKDGIVRVLNLKGLLKKNLGEVAQAIEGLEEAVRAAANCPSGYLRGFSLMNLGTLHHDQGNYPKASELYQAAIEVEKEHPHPLLSCKLRHNWLNLLYHSGRALEAQQASYELLKAALHFRFPDQEAAAFNYLGLLSGQRGQIDRQVRFFNQAAGLLKPGQFPGLTLQILLNRGFAQWGLKHFTAAQFDGESALALSQNFSETGLRSLALILLGRVLRDRPKPDTETASRLFNQAHELIWRQKNQQLLWELEFDRGLLAKKKREMARALQFFRSSREALKAFLEEIPETMRQSYLRDRKLEKIEDEIQSFEP